jgi:hypothetical protein
MRHLNVEFQGKYIDLPFISLAERDQLTPDVGYLAVVDVGGGENLIQFFNGSQWIAAGSGYALDYLMDAESVGSIRTTSPNVGGADTGYIEGAWSQIFGKDTRGEGSHTLISGFNNKNLDGSDYGTLTGSWNIQDGAANSAVIGGKKNLIGRFNAKTIIKSEMPAAPDLNEVNEFDEYLVSGSWAEQWTPKSFFPGDIDLVANTITVDTTNLNVGDMVTFSTTGSAPTVNGSNPLQDNIPYAISSISGNEVTLRQDIDSPLDLSFTAAGTGTHTITYYAPEFGDLTKEVTLVDVSANRFTLQDTDFLRVGTSIQFTSTGTLPAPLQAGVFYKVESISSFPLGITIEENGVQVDITDAGTGDLSLVFRNEPLIQYGSEKVGWKYLSEEDFSLVYLVKENKYVKNVEGSWVEQIGESSGSSNFGDPLALNSAILGGVLNSVAKNARFSSILGGQRNEIEGDLSSSNLDVGNSILGGLSNKVGPFQANSAIIGGSANYIEGNPAEVDDYSNFIAGSQGSSIREESQLSGIVSSRDSYINKTSGAVIIGSTDSSVSSSDQIPNFATMDNSILSSQLSTINDAVMSSVYNSRDSSIEGKAQSSLVAKSTSISSSQFVRIIGAVSDSSIISSLNSRLDNEVSGSQHLQRSVIIGSEKSVLAQTASNSHILNSVNAFSAGFAASGPDQNHLNGIVTSVDSTIQVMSRQSYVHSSNSSNILGGSNQSSVFGSNSSDVKFLASNSSIVNSDLSSIEGYVFTSSITNSNNSAIKNREIEYYINAYTTIRPVGIDKGSWWGIQPVWDSINNVYTYWDGNGADGFQVAYYNKDGVWEYFNLQKGQFVNTIGNNLMEADLNVVYEVEAVITALPTSPAANTYWGLDAGFTGPAQQVALWDGSSWAYLGMNETESIYNKDNDEFLEYNGIGFVAPVLKLVTKENLAIGTSSYYEAIRGYNSIQGSNEAKILRGSHNTIQGSVLSTAEDTYNSAIIGGSRHTVKDLELLGRGEVYNSAIIGGEGCLVQGYDSFVSGSFNSSVQSDYSTIMGSIDSSIDVSDLSDLGSGNAIISSNNTRIIGGSKNFISGHSQGFDSFYDFTNTYALEKSNNSVVMGSNNVSSKNGEFFTALGSSNILAGPLSTQSTNTHVRTLILGSDKIKINSEDTPSFNSFINSTNVEFRDPISPYVKNFISNSDSILFSENGSFSYNTIIGSKNITTASSVSSAGSIILGSDRLNFSAVNPSGSSFDRGVILGNLDVSFNVKSLSNVVSASAFNMTVGSSDNNDLPTSSPTMINATNGTIIGAFSTIIGSDLSSITGSLVSGGVWPSQNSLIGSYESSIESSSGTSMIGSKRSKTTRSDFVSMGSAYRSEVIGTTSVTMGAVQYSQVRGTVEFPTNVISGGSSVMNGYASHVSYTPFSADTDLKAGNAVLSGERNFISAIRGSVISGGLGNTIKPRPFQSIKAGFKVSYEGTAGSIGEVSITTDTPHGIGAPFTVFFKEDITGRSEDFKKVAEYGSTVSSIIDANSFVLNARLSYTTLYTFVTSDITVGGSLVTSDKYKVDASGPVGVIGPYLTITTKNPHGLTGSNIGNSVSFSNFRDNENETQLLVSGVQTVNTVIDPNNFTIRTTIPEDSSSGIFATSKITNNSFSSPIEYYDGGYQASYSGTAGQVEDVLITTDMPHGLTPADVGGTIVFKDFLDNNYEVARIVNGTHNVTDFSDPLTFKFKTVLPRDSFSGTSLGSVIETTFPPTGEAAFIGGGKNNTTSFSTFSTSILGGENNTINEGFYSSITGGFSNFIGESSTNPFGSSTQCFIANGFENRVEDSIQCFIGVGTTNLMRDSSSSAIVSGAANNVIDGALSSILSGGSSSITGVRSSIVAGGFNNSITGSSSTNDSGFFIGTGDSNSISAAGSDYATVLNGAANNLTESSYSTIGNGNGNSLTDSSHSIIGSGDGNIINPLSNYSAILTGFDNRIEGQKNVILNGQGNYILNPDGITGRLDNMIGVGFGNSISGAKLSFIGTGQDNRIFQDVGQSTVVGSSIVGGFSNNLNSSSYSFIGGGSGANMVRSGYSAIVAGQNNLMRESANSFIGSPASSSITESVRSSIVSGSGNFIQTNAINSGIVSGINNRISSSWNSFIGSGDSHNIDPGSQNSFIGSGFDHIIDNNAFTSAIVAGEQNQIQFGSALSFVGAGIRNWVSAADSAIVSGYEGRIGTGSVRSFIGSGNALRIESNALRSFIGAGEQITISNNSFASFVGAGFRNFILDNAEYCFIGTGNENYIQEGAQNSAIVTGRLNTIEGDNSLKGVHCFIGAGLNNRINNTSGVNGDSAIVSGVNNDILSARCFIGSGNSNNIIASSPSSFVGSGESNNIGNGPYLGVGATAVSRQSAIIAGNGNSINHGAFQSAIIAGSNHTISEMSSTSFIGSGFDNIIGIYNTGSFIGSGTRNSILSNATNYATREDSSSFSAIITGEDSTIGAESDNSFIAVGSSNTIGQSSPNSAILSGTNNNIANGAGGSVITTGDGNTIAKALSQVGGSGAKAIRFGETAYASGQFNEPGSAQRGSVTLRKEIADDLQNILYLDGTGNQFLLEENSCVSFSIMVTVFGDANNFVYSEEIKGVIKKMTGSPAVIAGSLTTTTLADEFSGTVSIGVTALTNALSISCTNTGSSAANKVWAVATMDYNQVIIPAG